MPDNPSDAIDPAAARSWAPAPDGPKADGVRNPVLADFWVVLKRLPRYLKLAAALVRDPDVPRGAKAILAVGGAYAVSPIDLVPGIIPVAGQLDDLYVILTALRIAVRSTPDATVARHLFDANITVDDIDRDLAAVRALVRAGIVRGARFGGRTVRKLTTSATAFVRERRRRGEATHDQESIQPRT